MTGYRARTATASTARHAARAAALSLIGLALVAFLAGPVAAHPTLDSSDPADGAAVADPITQVRITFSEPVTPIEVVVQGPDGVPMSDGPPQLVSGEVVTQRLRPWTDRGVHRVTYRVLAVDEHLTEGTFTFRYTGPIQVAAPSPTEDGGRTEPRPGEATTSLGAWPLVLVLGLAVVAAAATVRTVRSVGIR